MRIGEFIGDCLDWIGGLAEDVSEWAGIRVLPARLTYGHEDDPETVTLAVPGYRQVQSYTCGPVAGAMVLHTFRPQAKLNTFFALARPDPENGTPHTRLIRALRQSRIGVSLRSNLNFSKIASLIDQGYPIIATVEAGEAHIDHWVVIYGDGRSPRRVFVAGEGFPWFCYGPEDWGEFQSRWSPKGAGLFCWGK